ncbi:MAG: hypothetical protein LC643_03055 [Bacteroidales bacterium]|nr:hypothetical protein [Bacteroidales bacterium]
MKTMCFAFSMILSLMLSSCSNDESLDRNNFSTSALIFKATIITDSQNSGMSEAPQSEDTDTILFFSGRDIAWFKESTGELKFNDDFSGTEMIGNGPAVLHVYSDYESLYSINFFHTSDVMSYVINSPVIVSEVGENACYIENGYPYRDLADLDKDDPWRIEREMNWNALVQSEGWKLFIMQLEKEGRYRE